MQLPDAGAVHLWRLRLDAFPADALHRVKLLSDEERDRLERFRTIEGQRSFLLSRSTLRLLLGRYLRQEPQSLQIGYSTYGKPEIAGIHFSVSHSFAFCVFAFARESEIGVDLECVRALPDRDDLASRFFSPREASRLASVDSAQKDRAFFDCWTRKEAYVKAMGTGLLVDLTRFEVTLAPNEEARIIQIDGSTEAAASWQVHSLEPGPRHTGALIYRGDRKQLCCFECD